MPIITPTLTITSKAHSTASDSGPTTQALAVSVTDSLDITEVRQVVRDVSTTGSIIFDADGSVNSFSDGTTVAGTDGGFVFIKNLTEGMTTTADIYIGFNTGAAEMHDTGGEEGSRLMTLKPGEFSFFAWDLEKDIVVDASAAVSGALEATLFLRTTSV
jgi:hypothetical protein